MNETVMLPVRVHGGPCDGQQIEVRATLTPMGRPVLPHRIELPGEDYQARYSYDLTGPDSAVYRYVPDGAGSVRPDEETP